MVKYYQDELDQVFFALADSTRRGILLNVRNELKTARELAAPYDMSLPAISKHLKVLEKAKLLKREVRGRQHFFKLRAQRFKEVHEWSAFYLDFWNEKLDNLEHFLAEEDKES